MPNEDVIARLAAARTVDITTTGRRSGNPARIEIWWFHVDDRFIITGTPGKRDWYANVLADPSLTVHAPFGDFSGRASIINDAAFRKRVFTDPAISWYRSQSELEQLVELAPMIEVHLD
ncbi:MAG: nitroreductase family deazaflavin-dependent oxidoreductase [Acidimicrobiia bacterium]|nr:nitroreductase family deazaflavin-dependent oxidoreductase [Acidimicrobiia bacterium]